MTVDSSVHEREYSPYDITSHRFWDQSFDERDRTFATLRGSDGLSWHAHPGNTYFRGGRPGLLDWQVVRRGHPARDLTYTLVRGLPTAERQAAQHDLLEVYRQALAAAGGPEFDRDELFTRYRQAVAYAYVSPLTTAALGGMQVEAIAFEGLERAVNAIGDLETVAALRQSL